MKCGCARGSGEGRLTITGLEGGREEGRKRSGIQEVNVTDLFTEAIIYIPLFVIGASLYFFAKNLCYYLRKT